MKIRRIAQKKKDCFVAQVQKMKSFGSPDEARRWADEVNEILAVAAAGPSLGLSPCEAVVQRFGGSGSGSGSGSAA